MSANKRPRQKHVPVRTCVGCRETLAKREMTRIVRQSDGILIDPSGKLSGRGAYIHNQQSCWEKALRGGLAKALKTELTALDIERLKNYAVSMPGDQRPVSPEATEIPAKSVGE